MKKIFKYKNLLGIFVFFVGAIFLSPLLDLLLHRLYEVFGLYTTVILGFFYSFAFTGGATAVTLSGVQENFLIFSLLTAVGSVFADLTILQILKTGLRKEIESLFGLIQNHFKVGSASARGSYLYLIIGVIIIGSPLPDEIGVYLVHRSGMLEGKRFLLVSFVANFTFIYFITRLL